MEGRNEHNKKIDSTTNRILLNAPSLVKKFSNTSGMEATTRLMYTRYAIHFTEYMKNQLGLDTEEIQSYQSIKKSDIDGYLKYIKANLNGKEDIMAARLYGISAFFRFLVEDDYITKNPCNHVKAPKSPFEKKITFMTPDEVKLLKRNIMKGVGDARSIGRQKKWKYRDLAMVTLGVTTGLRCTELTEINLDDIDFNNNTITVIGKGDIARTVYVPNDVMVNIKDWMSDREKLMGDATSSALFISNKRTRISQRAVADMLKKYSVGIDKNITPHKMRASCGTNLYSVTRDIYLVQKTLGHHNIENTKRYIKVLEEEQSSAVNILSNLYK